MARSGCPGQSLELIFVELEIAPNRGRHTKPLCKDPTGGSHSLSRLRRPQQMSDVTGESCDVTGSEELTVDARADQLWDPPDCRGDHG